MNTKLRTYYPSEFKLQLVALAHKGDRAVRSLEREYGLSANLLRQWVQEVERNGAHAFVRRSKEGDAAMNATNATSATSATTESAVAVQATGDTVVAGEATFQALWRKDQEKIARLERDVVILKKALALLGSDPA